jgi:excisionase family DNA binding protein
MCERGGRGTGGMLGRAAYPGPRAVIDPPHAEGLRDEGDLLTADEVAVMLRMTKAWVYAQTRANRIPHVSLGRYVRYRRSAVLDWLGEIEQESAIRPFS